MESNMIEYKVADDADIEGARLLLDENFRGTLDTDEMKDGFISVRFSFDDLKEMANDGITIVARAGDKIAGVLCTQTCDYNLRKVPLGARLIGAMQDKLISGVPIEADKSLVCGPVCISKDFRGQGVLVKLYDALKIAAAGKFTTGLTLVSQANPRSIRAHEKLGFEKIETFESDGRPFDAFAMKF